jgi:RHS repeat-associated protein
VDNNVTSTYSPNAINQYTTGAGSSVVNGPEHEIQTYSGVTYGYINDERLRSAAAGTTTYSMVYDALGRCVKRSISSGPTTYYIYDGEKPILEYDSGGTSAGVNVYGKGVDEILERVAAGAVYYPQQNHEGSVTFLTDTSGNVIERYRYDAFGAPTFYTGTWGTRSNTIYDNRFLFTGREYAATYRSTTTPAFNFYEYRARAYHPGLGRFTSEDPKLFDAGDYNLFRYCHNDPIDMTDPMGLQDTVAYSPQQMSEQIASTRELVGLSSTYMRAAQSAMEGVMGAMSKTEGSTQQGTRVNWKETGNWQDRKIANHYVEGPLYVKGQPAAGKTEGKIDVYGSPDSSVTAEVNVNWYVDRKFAGTNVVTRELQHVQGWRDWVKEMKTNTFITFANRSYGSSQQAAAAVRTYLTPRVLDFQNRQYWRYDRAGGPHDLNYFPASPAAVPEYDYTH